MKHLILFLSFIIISATASAQKKTVICGKVNSAQAFVVNIYVPVNGYHNAFFVDTTAKNSVLINGKDSIYRSFKLDAPAFVNIRFTNPDKSFINRTDILLFPGDSVNMHFNLSTNSDWIEYHGSNAAGQKLFNDINYQPYLKFVPIFDALNRLPNNKQTFINEIDAAVADNTAKFRALKTVSPQFVELMDATFRTFFYGEVINKLIYRFKQREVLSKQERDAILENLASRLPGTDPRLKGLHNSLLYFMHYFDYLTYKKYHLNDVYGIQSTEREYTSNGHKYMVGPEIGSVTYIEDKKIREDLWAMYILELFATSRGKYDRSMIDQYCTIFPGNKWERFLRRQLADFPVPDKITYTLQSPVKYIDSTKSVKKFDALLKELPKGKAVFVDCWATWCSPCVSAFTFNKPLDSLLLANHIERLYISIDDRGSREKWEKAANRYCLGGYHILAGNDLITDVKKICSIPQPEKSPIAIPRYLLVDKNGVVVIDNAVSPHDFVELKDQITKAGLLN